MSDDQIFISHLMMVNTIGLSILCATMKKAASYHVTSSNSTRSEASRCYSFVQGTGLDMLLITYGLDYDPSRIRYLFNWCMNHKGSNGTN